jgi:hypothetical protein
MRVHTEICPLPLIVIPAKAGIQWLPCTSRHGTHPFRAPPKRAGLLCKLGWADALG